jgi:hypothetical protein
MTIATAVLPVTEPDVAVIVTAPAATPVNIPVLVMEASEVAEEDQLTDELRF